MHSADEQAARFLGIAGPMASDAEKASLKQAVFLMRYRARLALLVPPGSE
jgi:hypothetical protein